jgi:hypothetical protein
MSARWQESHACAVLQRENGRSSIYSCEMRFFEDMLAVNDRCRRDEGRCPFVGLLVQEGLPHCQRGISASLRPDKLGWTPSKLCRGARRDGKAIQSHITKSY